MNTGIGDSPKLYSWPVSSVVAEICERSGVPAWAVDLFGLGGITVDGFYMDNSYSAFTGLQSLSRIFMFDPSCWDGKLHFIPRGGDVVAELTSDDLIDDGEEIEKLTRKDSISIARVYHMSYYDIDGGLNADIQTSDRSVDARSKSEVSTETTVLMNADDAARAVAINHKTAIEEQRGTYEFSLPDSYLYLVPGNCIKLNGERLRISEIEINDGYQHYVCQYDRQSAYTSSVLCTPVYQPSTPPSLIIGDTVLHFIDSHIIKDSDDKLGYYVAVAGTTTNWKGALAELSTDGGQTYNESYADTVESVCGVLTVGCGTHDREYPDEINSFTVQLTRSDMEIEGATLAQMMSKANLAIVGNELINFGSVDEVSAGVWSVSYLLRGRKGSAITSHLAGERFILLSRQELYFIEADLFNLNRQLTFRVTSLGKSSSTVQTVSFTGQSQTEQAPSYLSAYRDSGNVVISWQGVGKLGGATSIAMGQYFTGYRVTVNGASQTTALKTITVTDPGGSVIISVSQLNSITGAGPETTVTI